MEIGHIRVSQQVVIAEDAPTCFAALTGDVSDWWGSPYLLIERPETRVHVDARLGGLVSERSGDEEASWGSVTELAPNRLLSFTGRMGMGDAVTGTARFVLTDRGQSTLVDLEQESIGAFGDGFQAAYDLGWLDLLLRLKAFVEEGARYGVAGSNIPAPDLDDHHR